MNESFGALIIATISIAVIHSFAPDHWMPFVMIGKAQNWSRRKLSWVTMLAGFAHVGSSVVLGSIGIIFGIAAIHLQGVEAARGEVAVFLLIGFGLAYGIWGFKHSKNHHHHSFDLSTKKIITLWTMFAVFVLGPCEPLIPLMFLATGYGIGNIVLVAAVFASATLFMMVGQALLGFSGVQLIRREITEKYSHALAGGIIILTGVFLYFI